MVCSLETRSVQDRLEKRNYCRLSLSTASITLVLLDCKFIFSQSSKTNLEFNTVGTISFSKNLFANLAILGQTLNQKQLLTNGLTQPQIFLSVARHFQQLASILHQTLAVLNNI